MFAVRWAYEHYQGFGADPWGVLPVSDTVTGQVLLERDMFERRLCKRCPGREQLQRVAQARPP